MDTIGLTNLWLPRRDFWTTQEWWQTSDSKRLCTLPNVSAIELGKEARDATIVDQSGVQSQMTCKHYHNSSLSQLYWLMQQWHRDTKHSWRTSWWSANIMQVRGRPQDLVTHNSLTAERRYYTSWLYKSWQGPSPNLSIVTLNQKLCILSISSSHIVGCERGSEFVNLGAKLKDPLLCDWSRFGQETQWASSCFRQMSSHSTPWVIKLNSARHRAGWERLHL